MTETPNQKRQREQHEMSIATIDTLLGGFAPLSELATTNVIDLAGALRQAGIGIVTVLQQMKAEAVADFERRKDWP